MKTRTILNNDIICFNCNNDSFSNKFEKIDSVKSGQYTIVQCDSCSMAFMQVDEPEDVDYSDYGDHITNQDECYYDKRINRVSLFKKTLFYYFKRKYGINSKILDFGSGAGFFIKSCQNYGFSKVYGVEPSDKLRNVACTKLNLDSSRLFKNINDTHEKFDIISMLDVIEHLPVNGINRIMKNIVGHMNPGAILLGTTPNLNSLNVKLFKDKDPAIAPPQHSIYFTNESLDLYLQNLGLRKRMLLVAGLSTNSFFRVDKFTASWIERPRGFQRPLSFIIKIIFKIMGALLIPFGAGYNIYFIYENVRDEQAVS